VFWDNDYVSLSEYQSLSHQVDGALVGWEDVFGGGMAGCFLDSLDKQMAELVLI
jgi:hypothetical protein